MSDLDKDLVIKIQKYLTEKQFRRLKYEVDLIGDVEKQHPLIIFYYASSIVLNTNSKNEDLLFAPLMPVAVLQYFLHHSSLKLWLYLPLCC